MSGLKNPFSEKTRQLFLDVYSCWWCGKNHADCLHHILKRVSNSPLNAAPIYNQPPCHLYNSKLSTREVRISFLQKTYYYLKGIGYQLTKKDLMFIAENKELYEWLPIEVLQRAAKAYSGE